MKNILVFFGGKSCEHDISVITGVLTLNSIDKTIFNPYPVYISRGGEWYTGKELFDVSFYKNFSAKKLKKVTLISGESSLYIKAKKLKKLCDIYSAINCTHGLNGEDGSLSGLLKLHNIPLASPSLFASSLSIDKEYTKFVLSGIKVKCLDYVKIVDSDYYKNKQEAISKIERSIEYPLIIKPCNLGSSIGVSSAKNQTELERAIETALIYDDKLIVEKKLEDFIELNCACYGGENKVVVSQVERPISVNDLLTFQDKYESFSGGGEREFPARISKKDTEKVRQTTEKIYQSLGFEGIIRVDYLLSNGKLYVNEINTVPGSLAYYLFTDTLKEFSNVLTEIIEVSVKNFSKYQSRKFDYKSGVLNINGAKGGKLKNN